MILSKIFAAFMSLLAAIFPSFTPPNITPTSPTATNVVSTSEVDEPSATNSGSSGGSSFLCGLGSSDFCAKPKPKPKTTTSAKPTFKPIETTTSTSKAPTTNKTTPKSPSTKVTTPKTTTSTSDSKGTVTQPTSTTVEPTTNTPDINPGIGGFDIPGEPAKTTPESTTTSQDTPVVQPISTTEEPTTVEPTTNNPDINPGIGGFDIPGEPSKTTSDKPEPSPTTTTSTGGGFDMPTPTEQPGDYPEVKDVIDIDVERGILYPEWNDYRLQNGKTPLRQDDNVERAAQRWADKLVEIARNNNGSIPSGYVHEKQYAAIHPEWNAYPSRAENVFTTSSPLSVRNTLTSFINSPVHNRNLQYENGKSYINAGIGIGSYQKPDGGWMYFVVYKVY